MTVIQAKPLATRYRRPGGFQKGNPGGGYSTTHAKLWKFRRALFQCITVQDFKLITKKLIEKAKDGEDFAIHELLDRIMGKSAQPIDLAVTNNTPDGHIADDTPSTWRTAFIMEALERAKADIEAREAQKQLPIIDADPAPIYPKSDQLDSSAPPSVQPKLSRFKKKDEYPPTDTNVT